MGLVGWFKENRQKRKLKSYEKFGETLRGKVTNRDQRYEAIESLKNAPAEVAIPQLLKRFELVTDSGLQDTKEKQWVSDIIVEFGEVAKPFIRKVVETSRFVSWPLKLAERLFSHEEYLGMLLGNLRHDFVEFDESVQERNVEILLALKEVRDPGIVDAVVPLLKSRDDGVRMAAVECLESQAQHHESARKAIVDLLREPPTDDNSRFLGLVRAIAERHNWKP